MKIVLELTAPKAKLPRPILDHAKAVVNSPPAGAIRKEVARLCRIPPSSVLLEARTLNRPDGTPDVVDAWPVRAGRQQPVPFKARLLIDASQERPDPVLVAGLNAVRSSVPINRALQALQRLLGTSDLKMLGAIPPKTT